MNIPTRLPLTLLAATCSLLGALSPAPAHAAAGDLYESDLMSGTIFKFTPDGTKTIFASSLTQPDGIVFDRVGNLYVASESAGTITKISPSGTQTPFASGLNHPSALAFDASGTLYVAETFANQIVQFSPAGTKTTYTTSVVQPVGLAFDVAGNLFVTEQGGSQVISKFGTGKTKTTFASNVDTPNVLVFDAAGNLYVSTYTPLGGTTGKILKFKPDGSRTTFASLLNAPYGMAFDSDRNLFVTERGTNLILKFDPVGNRTTFASSLSFPQFLAFEPPLSRPVNISTRLNVQSGENVLIGGVIITGTAPKKVVVRAIGPSLSNFGIGSPLLDPTLELRAANGALIGSNDNWKINDQNGQSQQAAVQATGLAPGDDRESVLMAEFAPTQFTAIVRGKNNTAGVALVEVYDVGQAADSRLANISTRGFVDTGNNVMIAGFIIGSGNGAAKVVARALGPSLTALGISNALADPTLELRNANGGTVEVNDDWKLSNHFDEGQEVAQVGLAPANDRESAVLATLPNGNYTVVVAGYNGGTGVGLVEVYNIR
ncbi:MAG TPA: SMP-30/gluconolactonase/LRE family protein [Chthoniobacterales bacterium]|nr:SMP-30/gluconolactonase/LRE family protein [Chthoniobacterales bacterium]